jgi:hypothetical protein
MSLILLQEGMRRDINTIFFRRIFGTQREAPCKQEE